MPATFTSNKEKGKMKGERKKNLAGGVCTAMARTNKHGGPPYNHRRPIARPIANQRVVLNGHKVHCLKYQVIIDAYVQYAYQTYFNSTVCYHSQWSDCTHEWYLLSDKDMTHSLCKRVDSSTSYDH